MGPSWLLALNEIDTSKGVSKGAEQERLERLQREQREKRREERRSKGQRDKQRTDSFETRSSSGEGGENRHSPMSSVKILDELSEGRILQIPLPPKRESPPVNVPTVSLSPPSTADAVDDRSSKGALVSTATASGAESQPTPPTKPLSIVSSIDGGKADATAQPSSTQPKAAPSSQLSSVKSHTMIDIDAEGT
jgi:hypothetical protein